MLRFVVSPDPRAEAPPARDNIEPVAALLLEAEPRHQRARKARRGRVGSASSRPRGTGRSDRPQIERLCRYVTRPPLAEDRLQLRSDDGLELTLKKHWARCSTRWGNPSQGCRGRDHFRTSRPNAGRHPPLAIGSSCCTTTTAAHVAPARCAGSRPRRHRMRSRDS